MAIHDIGNGCENGGRKTEEVTVLMVPLPAQGHLNQLLHLSRLISSYNIPVHYVCTPAHTCQAKNRIHGWDPLSISNIHFHEFPVPSYETPPADPYSSTKFPTQLIPAFFASIHLRESISSLMKQLSNTTRRLVVIHDSLMPYVIQDIGEIPNAESYAFQSVSAFCVYSYVWENEGEPEVPESKIFKTLPQRHYPEEFEEYIRIQFEKQVENSGNLFNTCRAIEGKFLDGLSKFKMSGSDKNWAVGPFNPVVINEKELNPKKRHYCLDWLDKQPPNSVIFVSFGSTTALSDEQIQEIAIGLEKSEQKFVWVARDADTGDLFKDGEARRNAQLPKGFETRTEGKGIVIKDWAPQLEILAHSSTGGFMSHCGWNSSIESISHGVPIAAWPMHSDQPANSTLITEELKVGLKVINWKPGYEIVTSETVENAVRRLMDSAEGEEIRERAKELSKAVKSSVLEGASRMEMDSFIARIRR
ncbi:OLC1v1036722C1 [Oldenlandia corymbosa var. corymbosa]|uniref:Glycosyltransferase n=1 Tax=Oldenlandia corymbosa var. corymbosa TaxID=529605 RepID=A0AAV1CY21_OLDCO|nr:OLC1v1036722C1 [Oldenlandia corymbosa var. corymbosa]